MTIVNRRIFQAKVGQSGPLVEHFQVAVEQMAGFGINWETRICTEYHSGRSDRVSVEWLVEDLSDIDSELGRIMEMPEAAEFFQAWLAKLNDMVLHSDAENWSVI
jgi:hypothetical protein